MGLEDVKKGLEKQLEKERKHLIEQAQDEAKQILADAKEQVKAYKAAVKKDTDKQAETLKRKELSTAKLSKQKMVLTAKKDQIDEAFAKAKQELLGQSESKRRAFLEELYKQAQSQIDVHVVYCAKQDKNLLEGAKVDETIEGGIICETKDGSQRVNLTVERILADVRQAHLREVADTLL